MSDILDRWLSTASTTELGIAVGILLAIIWMYAYAVVAVVKWMRFSRRVTLTDERLRVVGYAPERGER